MKYRCLLGVKFTKLTVVSESLEIHSYKDGRAPDKKFVCLCDCGKTVLVRRRHLIGKTTRSCGCLQKEAAKNNGKLHRLPLGKKPKNDVFGNYKTRAAKNSLEFAISFDEFTNLASKNCYYCDSPPSNKAINHRDTNDYFVYNGMDRIDSLKGYTSDNVVSCCYFCNIAKSDWTQEEFINKVKKLYENLHKKHKV